MKVMTVLQEDGSKWAVPVEVIARSRAAHYAHEFGGDVERSLAEDTLPMFADDPFEIEDWASNNMNWSDVQNVAFKCGEPSPPDFQEAWINGEKEITDVQQPEPANIRKPFAWWVKYANGYEDIIQRLPTDVDSEDMPSKSIPLYAD